MIYALFHYIMTHLLKLVMVKPLMVHKKLITWLYLIHKLVSQLLELQKTSFYLILCVLLLCSYLLVVVNTCLLD